MNNIPAFPSSVEHGLNDGMPGMTLRDYFAAKAMAECTWTNFDASAEGAYKIADAMMKAREA